LPRRHAERRLSRNQPIFRNTSRLTERVLNKVPGSPLTLSVSLLRFSFCTRAWRRRRATGVSRHPAGTPNRIVKCLPRIARLTVGFDGLSDLAPVGFLFPGMNWGPNGHMPVSVCGGPAVSRVRLVPRHQQYGKVRRPPRHGSLDVRSVVILVSVRQLDRRFRNQRRLARQASTSNRTAPYPAAATYGLTALVPRVSRVLLAA
jgi:hypothetical protein